MRRRDFLVSAASLAGTVVTSPSFGAPLNRAAVVIGVDRAGNLPRLRAAASGAKEVANWLGSEGFEIELFTDEKDEVRVTPIVDAVHALVDRPNLDQLVVYFAGHGFLHSYSEHWMLSRAPDNANEAISLNECWYLATQSGIPNVVLISDACRSSPDSLNVGQVRGSVIFPNRTRRAQRASKVDRFLATVAGNPALEVAIGDNVREFEGIYTSTFMKAFEEPDDHMVVTLPSGQRVVPNRRLEAYLSREVPRRAQARNITFVQTPQTEVVSGDLTYIAQVLSRSDLDKDWTEPPRYSLPEENPVTIFDLPEVEISRDLGDYSRFTAQLASSARFNAKVEEVADRSGFRATRNDIIEAGRTHFNERLETGFAISGADVVQVIETPNARARMLSPNSVSVDLGDSRTASVILRFADGSGTVVAALDGFVGRVVVGKRGVTDISYDRNGRVDEDTLRLRSIVAASAQSGVFRMTGQGTKTVQRALGSADPASRDFLADLPDHAGIDPTLSLYAAYAYHDADDIDSVRFINEIMRSKLGKQLFDVAMLADSLNTRNDRDGNLPTFQTLFDDRQIVPFCPALSKGWSFLRVKGISLPARVDKARNHLQPALWTTFNADGMEHVIAALSEGDIR